MSWKEVRVVEQRLKFVMEAEKGDYPFVTLCQRYGISRKTGYKWLKRYRDWPDPRSLADISRAPHTCPSLIGGVLAGRIESLRKEFPHWGPRKLLAKLRREEPKTSWPAPSTAGRILKRAGLITPQKRRRRTPPYTKPFGKVTAPNQVWCIDFKGHFRTGDGKTIYPLTIMDAFSRYLLRCQIVRAPNALEVWKIFESAFLEFGLPEAIRSDNGPPFASIGPGGLTELSAWWIRLGIRHERIEPGKPQQNGRHERMHLTLKREACTPPSVSVSGQQGMFDRFQKRYNEERPHEALQYRMPAEFYAPSDKRYSVHAHQDLYAFGVEAVLADEKGRIRWKDRMLKVGEALKGQMIDVHMMKNKRWTFSYGPVVLGIFDERKATQGLMAARTKKVVSPMFSV